MSEHGQPSDLAPFYGLAATWEARADRYASNADPAAQNRAAAYYRCVAELLALLPPVDDDGEGGER